MSKHTPGPWQIKRLLLHPDEVVAVGDVQSWFVADCQTTARPSEEVAANVHLIASAPDLLDALIQCRQLLDNLQGRQLLISHALGGHFEIDNETEIGLADAAIAKARGE